jgi:hypothetical protein
MKKKLNMTIRLERNDDIPAFGGYLRCEPPCDGNHVILMNVSAVLSPYLEGEGGEKIEQTKEERKRLVITTLMHEFGHALEAEFGLPDSEEAIDKAIHEWELQWMKAETPS